MAKPKGSSGSKTAPPASTYDVLARSIKGGEVMPIYLLFGEEEFLIEQILRALTNLVIAPGMKEADLYKSDMSSARLDAERLSEWVMTPPFLSSKRLVILKNTGLFGANSPEQADAAAYIKLFSSIPDTSCLVFVEDKIDKRKKALYEAVAKEGTVVNFSTRSADELSRWIAFSLKKYEIRITVDAIGSLIDRCEGSMRLIDNEVKKLVLTSLGRDAKEVSLEDIDAICIPDIRGSVFQMTDAIGARDVNRALTVLDTLIALKEPIPRIRFMLARHIRQLICAKELVNQESIISSLKVVPFVARNLSSQARSFRMEELLSLYEACANSDYNVKTGKMEDRLSMEILLAEAAKRS